MKVSKTVVAAAALLSLLSACGARTGGNNAAAAANQAAPAGNGVNAGNAANAATNSAGGNAANASGLGDSSETVTLVQNCVLETPEGHYDGPCERVEWGGPSFSIRRPGGAAFYAGVTEAVVEVDRPGEAAGGSYRNNGELVSAGPLSFRDDCACWARPNMRVGAQQQ